MKTILFFTTLLTLLTCTGCLVAEGPRHGHHHEGAVFVPAPVVVVPAPVVVVPAPVIVVPVPVVRVR